MAAITQSGGKGKKFLIQPTEIKEKVKVPANHHFIKHYKTTLAPGASIELEDGAEVVEVGAPVTDVTIDHSPADADNVAGFFSGLLTDAKLKLKAAFDRIVEKAVALETKVTGIDTKVNFQEIAGGDISGTVELSFNRKKIISYNLIGATNFTLALTGNNAGFICLLKVTSTSDFPAFSSAYKPISGSFELGKTNYIDLQYISDTEVLYDIWQL
jgi:hypothetical protein